MKSREIKLGRFVIRFNWLVALAVLATVAGLTRLGIWQMSRAQEKIEEQEQFTASGLDEATPISQVPIAGLEYDALQHQNRRVVMQGRYLNENNIFLIYQTYEEQLGYEVITPLALADPEQLVLVSRGWSPVGSEEELARTLPPITGVQTVEGQIFVPSEKMANRTNDSRNSDWPLLRRYVNISELQTRFEQPLFPYVVRLSEGEEGVLIRHWPEVVVNTERHFSYALQWFAMAIAVLTTALILSSNVRDLFRRKP